jgi:5,10-methylenetetrahydromethanopterin reductase
MKGVELTPEIPVEAVADLGALAEAEGFDAVLASYHYNNRDPWMALDRVAAATDDVLVGPAAANPYDTHPAKLAGQAATLQEVSGGRALLGLGAGDRSTLRNLGVERDRPLRRVLESMRVSKRLWAGERVDHDGTFVARDAGLNFEVDAVPVYVGAQGPHMIRMAAKHADGVLVNASHPADVEWAAERVAGGRAERPASRGEFDFGVFASVSVAEDGAAAREAARPPVAFIAAGAAEPVLDRHGLDAERAASIGEHIEAGEFDAAFDAVTPAMIDAFAVAGTVEEVEERAERLLSVADSLVVGSPLGPDREQAVRLAARAVGR